MTRTTARQRMMLRANGAEWYRIKNLADGTAEISIYDEIGYLGITAQGLINELKLINAEQISLRINSPGGEIFDGIAIMNAIRSHPAMVTTYVDGVAASIASVIAMAGDRVVMMPNSQLMIHDGSGLCVGDAQDMRDMADLLDKQSDNIAQVYRDKAGGLAKTWRNRMRAETWYSAEEAVRAGLADEVAQMPQRRREEMSNRWDLSIYRYAGRDQAPPPPLMDRDAGVGDEDMPEDVPDMQARAVGPHESDTAEGDWDRNENVGRLPSPVPLDVVGKVFALYDSGRVEDGAVPKDACDLPHHFVSADGTPGAASMNGVRAALSRLTQTEGYTDEELETARQHLRSHLEDGGGGEEEGEPEARTEAVMSGWSPDLFRTAMAKASGMPPEDLPDTFRNAVTAAAGQASAVPARTEPVPDPTRLGWSDPTPTPERAPTAGGMFRDAVTAAAGQAAAIPARPAPAPNPASLGWQQPAPPPEPRQETAGDIFRSVLAREANRAPAVISAPTPEPERDPYDPTVVIRALREANQQ